MSLPVSASGPVSASLPVSGHGGNVRRLAEAAGVTVTDLLDFSASINPLGPPEWLRAVVLAHLGDVEHYPDEDCSDLVQAITTRYEIPSECVVVCNGTAEIIAALPRVLPVARAVIPVPTYVDYAVAATQAGLEVEAIGLDETRGFALDAEAVAARLRGGEVVFVGRPNNPTGVLCRAEYLISLAVSHPCSWFVVDEAFVEFAEDDDGSDGVGLLRSGMPNLVVLRSLTKLYAIPGLRLGLAVVPRGVAPDLRRAMAPWSVNALAQAVGIAALADKGYVDATRVFVREERARLMEGLSALPGLRVFPGSANYLLVKMERGPADARGRWPADARELAERLLQKGLAVRVCDDFDGLDRRYFRVAVRKREENERLVREMEAILVPQEDLGGQR